MILKNLTLRNFRNYRESSFEFSPDINIILGPNARGKTSLLEAIALLSIGRSFRAMKLTDMINKEEEAFYLETEFSAEDVNQKISMAFDGTERRILHNSTYYPSLSSLVGLIPLVVMTPDDDLIKGPPQSRRRFLDMQIVQYDRNYLTELARYVKAMRQRNVLLRSESLKTIDLWEEEMARSAAYLVKSRLKFIDNINGRSLDLYEQLTGSPQNLSLAYRGHPDQENFKDFYLERFEAIREKEVKIGSTLTGPHRDDVDILIDNLPARHFGSEGQKRTGIAALRLASWQLLKQLSGKKPLMLVDDFGLSLDADRRQQFLDCLSVLGQVFITTVNPIPAESLSKSCVITI